MYRYKHLNTEHEARICSYKYLNILKNFFNLLILILTSIDHIKTVFLRRLLKTYSQ